MNLVSGVLNPKSNEHNAKIMKGQNALKKALCQNVQNVYFFLI